MCLSLDWADELRESRSSSMSLYLPQIKVNTDGRPRADPCSHVHRTPPERRSTSGIFLAWPIPRTLGTQALTTAAQSTITTADNTNTTALEQFQQVIYPLIFSSQSRKDGQEESFQVRHPARIYIKIKRCTTSGATRTHG
jgi:hypothetical protein